MVPPGAAINATIERIRAEAVESYKAGQQAGGEASTLPAPAEIAAPLTNPQVWEHKSLEVPVKALPPAPAMEVGTIQTGPTIIRTMSSIEIAELVEARHDNVKRTIQTLAGRGVITLPQYEEVSNPGPGPKLIGAYRLGKRDSFVVVAQLSPEFTGRVVDRWQELEAQVAQQPQAPAFALPKTFAEALRLSADLQEANEKLAEEKALAERQRDNNRAAADALAKTVGRALETSKIVP